MNGRQLIRTGLLLASALLIVACRRLSPVDSEGTEATAPPSVSHGGPVVDYASLVDALRAAGATVEPAGSIEQDFFEPEGQIIRVNQQDVQVFEFESEEAAQAAAGTISPDGSSTGTTMITWIATPHFYQAGNVIAVYVGDDSGVLTLLEEVLGEQFAGG